MTPEELGRIRVIYEQVLPMNGADRETHLDRECQTQQNVREGVERLLKARENIPTWLDRPAVGAAKAFVAPELPKMEGRHFSGYTLIREIGRGGMGAVYLAERSDDTFHRQAAIKLVLPPANSAAVIARFQQEREILASLDHPNIAKLLDAGITDEGWPYFVMEFVDGQPIHRWCDERKLNISQRLELFRGVIDAVRYAHQHLVVHRDLKPGNIFVTNDGVVKLLDFGIAKVLATRNAGEAPETLTLARMMTPEYASPEQVNGTAITTLSDVYSLGVVLYELLTGHRPYRLLSAAMHELARVIAEVEPARPSDVVAISEPASDRDRTQITPDIVSSVREGDPNRLRKRLVGDLDSILLLALRKEPERRYGSVESFAEDLQRHLEQRPVHAREASPWERFQHFRRRNPGGFLAAGLVAILFLAGLAAVALQARHDVLAARLDRGVVPYLVPLWLFSSGIAAAALSAIVYFGRPNRVQRLGAAVGGLAFGLGLIGRMWLERSLGLWWSRVEGNDDPLMLLSPLTWFVFFVGSAALLVVLLMIGRRFGWKGQILSLAVLGLYQAVRERIWIGEFIPALNFQPGWIPILASAGMIFAAGLTGLLTMRLIGGADGTTRHPK
jgi:eukaryotic-like serine/threonine-protein kinase